MENILLYLNEAIFRENVVITRCIVLCENFKVLQVMKILLETIHYCEVKHHVVLIR